MEKEEDNGRGMRKGKGREEKEGIYRTKRGTEGPCCL